MELNGIDIEKKGKKFIKHNFLFFLKLKKKRN